MFFLLYFYQLVAQLMQIPSTHSVHGYSAEKCHWFTYLLSGDSSLLEQPCPGSYGNSYSAADSIKIQEQAKKKETKEC